MSVATTPTKATRPRRRWTDDRFDKDTMPPGLRLMVRRVKSRCDGRAARMPKYGQLHVAIGLRRHPDVGTCRNATGRDDRWRCDLRPGSDRRHDNRSDTDMDVDDEAVLRCRGAAQGLGLLRVDPADAVTVDGHRTQA